MEFVARRAIPVQKSERNQDPNQGLGVGGIANRRSADVSVPVVCQAGPAADFNACPACDVRSSRSQSAGPPAR